MLQSSNLMETETILGNEEVHTKETGWKYLLLSLGAFLAICLEFIHAYGWEPFVFGNELTTWQTILHWIITCLTWGAAAYLLICIAKTSWAV